MTTYKGIRGLTIRTVEGDASPLIQGDIWYNSVTKKIRGAKIPAGAWSSGTDLNTARMFLGGVGPLSGLIAPFWNRIVLEDRHGRPSSGLAIGRICIRTLLCGLMPVLCVISSGLSAKWRR